jgi:hypothetical protein
MRLSTLLFFLCGMAGAFGQAVEKQPGRYIRFPESVSPDGEYVFAWGNSLSPGVPLETLVEAPYATWIDPGRFEIQDYLVETKRSRSPLVLPHFEYFSGAKGHEGKHGLTVAWSPDSRAALALYESDDGYVAAAWVEPAERRVTDVGKTFETKLRDLVDERFGAEEAHAQPQFFFSRIAVLTPRVLTIDGCLSRVKAIPEKPTPYWFRMRFSILTERESTRAQLVTSRVLHPDELPAPEPAESDAALEARMNNVFAAFRAQLPLEGREAAKKEQALWVKQRDALANSWNRAGFTRHRVEELKMRAAEYEPPQAP